MVGSTRRDTDVGNPGKVHPVPMSEGLRMGRRALHTPALTDPASQRGLILAGMLSRSPGQGTIVE